MANYFQRNRNQNRGQNSGGSFNQNSYQGQGNMGRQQMVNPWQNPMGQSVGGGGGLQTRPDEAALAFSILNQVLSTNSPSPASNRGHQDRQGGFQDRRSQNMGIGNRLEDRRGKSPQHTNRNNSDRGSRQWSNRSRSPHRANRAGSNSSRRDGSDYKRRNVMDRLGKDGAQRRRDFQSRKSKSTDRDRGDSDKNEDSRDSKSSQDRKDPAKEKENEEALIKSLKCHICEIDSFESIESFKTHKKSDDHRLLTNIFNARSEAALQLMKADSKLASNRDKEKAGNANKETFYGRCMKCNIDVSDAFKSHRKSIEHELVDSFLTRECCGSIFSKRKDYEEHRLTIPHLKRHGESSTETDQEKKVIKAFTDEEEAAGNILRDLKETHRMKLDSPADFPDYEEATPTGLSYVHKKRRFTCSVCKKSFPTYNTMAVAHCRSFNHYLMLASHLEKMLKEVEDEEDIADTDENKDENDEEENSLQVKEESQQDKEKEEKVAPSDAMEDVKNEEKEGLKDSKDNNDDEMDNENGDEEMEENLPVLEENLPELEENLPVLEDGGIILEESDKFDDDDEQENSIQGGEKLEDSNSIDNVEEKIQEEEKETPEPAPAEDKVMEVEEAAEKVKSDNSDEENEVEEVKKVKPKANRGRRGRGRGRSSRRF